MTLTPELPTKALLLSKNRFSEQQFASSGLRWTDLEAIFADFVSRRTALHDTARFLQSQLEAVAGAHSVRMRIKDPEHLIAKVIRKTLADPTRSISLDNYQQEITDLIGLRVLHLFKEDWHPIHEAIMGTWEVVETPVANIRAGDDTSFLQLVRPSSIVTKVHLAGYRSIHYTLRLSPTKKEHVAEVQVRTLFEEAWSEVDHRVRYPDNTEDELLSRFLGVFNRLAGGADEMASYVITLKSGLDAARRGQSEKRSVLSDEIAALQRQVGQLTSIKDDERRSLSRAIADLNHRDRLKSASFVRSLLDLLLAGGRPNPLAKQITEAMQLVGDINIDIVRIEDEARQAEGVDIVRAEEGIGQVTVRISDIDGNTTPEMIARVQRKLEPHRTVGVVYTVTGFAGGHEGGQKK